MSEVRERERERDKREAGNLSAAVGVETEPFAVNSSRARSPLHDVCRIAAGQSTTAGAASGRPRSAATTKTAISWR